MHLFAAFFRFCYVTLPLAILKALFRLFNVPIMLLGGLFKHTRIAKILRNLTHQHDCIEHIARETMAMKETEGDLLVHGKLREYAESILPPSQHPTWYVNVPKHLRRSIIVHGRIRGTNLAPAPTLAGSALTEEFVSGAYAAAVTSGFKWAWFTAFVFVALPLSALISTGTTGDLMRLLQRGIDSSIEAPASSWRSISAHEIAQQYADVYSQEQADAVQETYKEIGKAAELGPRWAKKIQGFVALPFYLAAYLCVVLLVAGSVGRMVFIARFRHIVHVAVDNSVSSLRKAFREGVQKWRYFLADRETNDKGINDQVNFAMNIDRSPLLYFGDAEGEFEHNGHLLAPRQGHEMKQSVIDMLQHTEVLGGSGESKSRDFYVPLLSQLLELRKSGYPIACYITDEKGAIVEDVIKITTKLGLTDDTIIIGTGPDDWRVDLMDAGRPVLIAELIKSASKQAGSTGGGDDFWSEMGNDLMLNIWTITEVAELTNAGKHWSNDAGYRMHSIKNALRLATLDKNLDEVIEMAVHGMHHEYDLVGSFDNDAFYSAVEYLDESWMPMVDATKDGIRANLRKALRTFTFKPEISSGFADGAGGRLLPASQLHSNKIKVLNVSQIEHGSAGRLVNIFLKSAFFKQCRDVQQQDPAFAERRLAWWFNPDMADAAKDSYYLEFFLADEYQSLITSDPTSGYSDATVWNVLRSAGVAGVTISQGVGAYEYAIGKDAAANVRRQWRSKHFLRSEDTQTIDEAKKLAGKTFRFQISSDHHYESTASIRRELGVDADNLCATLQWSENANADAGWNLLSYVDSRSIKSWDDAFAFDDRFVMGASATGDGSAENSSKQAAYWRHEDKHLQTMQHGLMDVDVLRDEQIMQMTRGRALTFLQVAGGTQIDIIRLNAKAYQSYTSTPKNWS